MIKHTAGSFTKNFSWHSSYNKLFDSVRNGFSGGPRPVTRDNWRSRSKLPDADRELIPLNFFLYSTAGTKHDYVLVDRLVEISLDRPYNIEFAQLALFAFHLANSGRWRKSKWQDGRVAGWANELIRNVAWLKDDWLQGAFDEEALMQFIDDHVDGHSVTKRKVFTNYRYMLTSAGVLVDGELQSKDLRKRWLIDATQLFWDRQIFDGAIAVTASESAYEAAFFSHEIHKLLRCDKGQGQAFVRAAFREYGPVRDNRVEQLRALRNSGLIAA